ncbi:MAG: chromosome segregation protein SMC [Kiritimatiellae bacterium]|nr:chromosome segregation protein SMC [Kiritimatiellia bacterium]
MHLKQIEIIGFKSFGEKTRLQFEPGMISIVGPNGCGKSNVSDAIRWVLGEQRPTSLRCARMTDLVFNGTDTRKPLGMAEVSITFTDCEGSLETDFNEVTIARRVFRSGEGQYFINKNPCRLKDIHRLFMGTGIGTTSYSVMAQGQIDAILSSRPEDRRAVFEEAAGITKFKADRKEALRKIDHTEANLTRLSDVIREVKRQINTLQRQAGKAQQYKRLRDQLRSFDLFLTRRRLADLDVRIRELDTSITDLNEKIAVYNDFVCESEEESTRIHHVISETEEKIAELTEKATRADNNYLRAEEVIRVNHQRIDEYKAWAERDNLEISGTQKQIDQLKMQMESLEQKRILMQNASENEHKQLEEAQEAFSTHEKLITEIRESLQTMRQESVACERNTAQTQNQLSELETKQRELIMKRERLTSEQKQVGENLKNFEKNTTTIKANLDQFVEERDSVREKLELLEEEHEISATEMRTLQSELSSLQSEAAAKQAQIDLLNDKKEASGEYPSGSLKLLDPENPLEIDTSAILGPLAEKFHAAKDMRLALEASLRAWLDTIIISDTVKAREIIVKLQAEGKQAAARIMATEGKIESKTPPCPKGLTPLLDHITIEEGFQAAAERLLGNVFLADSSDAVPATIPEGTSVVTREGAIFHANGTMELWMPESQLSSPLARRMLISDTTEQLSQVKEDLSSKHDRQEQLSARNDELSLQITQIRRELTEISRKAAQADGEYQSTCRDVERARSRFETVNQEVDGLLSETSGDDVSREDLTEKLHVLLEQRNTLLEQTTDKSGSLNELEGVFSKLSHNLTECRITLSSSTQQLEHTISQQQNIENHIEELNRTISGRSQGVKSYEDSIDRLNVEINNLETNLEPMKIEAETLHAKITETRSERKMHQRTLEKNEATLSERRRALDGTRENKSKAEVGITEAKMHHQNHLDHVYNEYGVEPEELLAHPDPEWENGEQPPLPEIASRVAKLNSELNALGPVNLVAIEEHKEHEERYAFLKAQEEDLIKSKEEILNLINTINIRSGELFQETFEQANTNFQEMFTKLFNGGQAKLVLLENKDDPLECGIDIIARPPGKRPQSVTLLSGGERTMTAVSLLFAIFKIKPSPFCMLDELDAALDDSNIGRFVAALKEFLAHSQFLIITHNQHTIAASDLVYGVTQQEKGISKVISMKLSEIGTKDLNELPDGPTIEVEANLPPPPKKRIKKAKKTTMTEVTETEMVLGDQSAEESVTVEAVEK